MAWVTKAALSSIADVSAAALVSQPTQTRAAVDARVGTVATPIISDIVANDDVVYLAAVQAVEDAAQAGELSFYKGVLESGTNVQSLTQPGSYGAWAGQPGGPAGAGSGYYTLLALTSGGGSLTSLLATFTEHATGRQFIATRTPTGAWSAWSRPPSMPEAPIMVTAGDLGSLQVGRYMVTDPAAVTGAPDRTNQPGLYERTGTVDTYEETGELANVWKRRVVDGAAQFWSKVQAEKIVPVPLSRPRGTLTEAVSSRSLRIPFQVPARAHRWRLVLRNVNYRTNTVYNGNVTLRTLCIGTAARDANGLLDGSMVESEQYPNGMRIILRDLPSRNFGDGWASGWQNDELVPGGDYMLSLGYQHNGVETTLGLGGGWWTAYQPMNAELRVDPSSNKTDRLPFDLRIEVVTDDGVQEDVLIGDSISAAANATLPVHDAPIQVADRGVGRAVRLHGFGGAAFGEWVGGAWADPASEKWLDVTRYGRADRAFIALGNNDIHDGATLATLKANFTSMVALLRERVSPNIVACTITPRSAWPGTAKETIREQFNDWLRSFPEAISGVADTARAVEDSTGHAPRTEFVHADGIHFNTAGSSALASALA